LDVLGDLKLFKVWSALMLIKSMSYVRFRE
jgi:hypothetical protein